MTDFKQTQSLFQTPEGVIYLDGNSLGPLPTAVADRVQRMIREQWGKELIRGWNSAGWMVSRARSATASAASSARPKARW